MNLFTSLEGFLYLVSVALFYPVLAALAALTVWTVGYLGAFAREAMERQRGNPQLRRYRERLNTAAADAGANDTDLAIGQALHEVEDAIIASLDRIRFVVRTGPSLGLIGTLIPMANALAALAQGNLPDLATNMVTAFSTTVIGLAIGTTGYLIANAKQRWSRSDLNALSLHADRLLREIKQDTGAIVG
jgi:biopolymer transport protein ExbB/TolQ